jgi:hypothetical protein
MDIMQFRQALSGTIFAPSQVNEKTSPQERPQITENGPTQHSHRHLIAHWEVENGKLICKWLVNRKL